MLVFKDYATLSLSPLIHTQTNSISFFISGWMETAGALTLQTTAEEAATIIRFTTTNGFGGRLTVENGATLNLSNFSGTSVNNDLQINEGAIIELLRNEQISDSHTTRVNATISSPGATL